MVEPSRSELRIALGVERWVDEMAGAGPFATVDDLVAAARERAARLTPTEVREALSHHPRIGERPTGSGAEAEHSRREQAASADDDPELARRLADGNAAYEQRFGRIFLIRAAGRSRAEIVAELERRLLLDDEGETREVAAQLAEIAALRLRSMFEEAA